MPKRVKPMAVSSLANESQFRHLLEKLPAGAYTCDPEGLITYFNRHAVQLWGREPKLNDPVDRFCGSFRLFAADGSPIAHDQCWMALALRTDEEYNGHEIIVERPDGSRLTVLAHANPIHDDSGKLLGAMNVLVDISDRKQDEEARSLLAAIVESSNDAIVSKTLDGRILTWNTGAERLFGYTASEAIGLPITLVIPPERHDEEQSILARLRRGERIEHYETVRLTKDGRRIDVSLTVSPVRDSKGRILGASKVARNVTEQKQAAAALVTLKDELAVQFADLQQLHQMSARLSTMRELQPILEDTLRTVATIEGTDLGLLSLCDPEQNYLHVVASLGFDEDFIKSVGRVPAGAGACGKSLQERRRVVIEDVEIDPIYASYRESARRAGFRAVHSTALVTRSGKAVGVLSTHFRQPHRPSDREKRLIDLCARQAADSIENARLYAELREADRHKDEFLATLAHELRNPLAPVSNSLHLLQLSDDLSPAVECVREIMAQQVNHLVRLVEDLMDVSRIAHGKIELQKETVELAAVVKNAIETARPIIEAAGHQLAITMPTEPIVLQADPVRLAQVIGNLLNNAAKYTEPGGQIWFSVRPEGAEIVISVRDTGLGIPADVLPHVFDMFAQADRTLVRAQGGLGIGLRLVKSLVEMHGGRIEAHSDGPDQGSEFVVHLPATMGAPSSGGRLTGRPASKVQLPPHRIVIVDDTQAAAFMLGKLLEAMGQRVHTSHDGASALEHIRADRPDVVISDIAMPHMDGYELARRVRQDPGLNSVVLVALTGYGQDGDRQRAREAGFDHHLVKPVSLEALQELLASLPARQATASS